jgi:hypothetical protein
MGITMWWRKALDREEWRKLLMEAKTAWVVELRMMMVSFLCYHCCGWCLEKWFLTKMTVKFTQHVLHWGFHNIKSRARPGTYHIFILTSSETESRKISSASGWSQNLRHSTYSTLWVKYHLYTLDWCNWLFTSNESGQLFLITLNIQSD